MICPSNIKLGDSLREKFPTGGCQLVEILGFCIDPNYVQVKALYPGYHEKKHPVHISNLEKYDDR